MSSYAGDASSERGGTSVAGASIPAHLPAAVTPDFSVPPPTGMMAEEEGEGEGEAVTAAVAEKAEDEDAPFHEAVSNANIDSMSALMNDEELEKMLNS
jgi:hypothetical protein